MSSRTERTAMWRWLFIANVMTVVLATPKAAWAWLLHEHAATARAALSRLGADARGLTAAAWERAARREPRLCKLPDSSGENLYDVGTAGQFCVGFPVLTGLSADHSCSPSDTRTTVRSDFVLGVLKEAENVELKLREAVVDKDIQSHVDRWHLHHINLQIADPAYLSRAEESGAHFQLPRQQGEQLRDYLRRVLRDGVAVNALALYLGYHGSAVALAHQAGQGCTWSDRKLSCPGDDASDTRRDELFAQAIATEAFALHFLQDAFSAGHSSTLSGSRAERMGTHDHYCQHGVAATTWGGSEYVAHGDAFLTGDDLSKVAIAAAKSLEQVAAAFVSDSTALGQSQDVAKRADFNACVAHEVPQGVSSLVETNLVEPLADVPRPGSDPPGLASFTKELGIFYSPVLGAALRMGVEDVRGAARDDLGSFSRLPLATHIGFGFGGTFEGITDGSTDGIVSLGAALLVDARPAGSRTGIRLGGAGTWHLPYYLIPGDTVFLAPFLLGLDWASGSNSYFHLLRRSAAGGLLGLQRRVAVGPGWHFQFLAGREGLIALMPPPENPDRPKAMISAAGTPGYIKMAFPVFSMTTFHSSSGNIGLDLIWQLGYDLTYYTRDETFLGGAPKGEVLHGIFLGFNFRARRYFYQL